VALVTDAGPQTFTELAARVHAVAAGITALTEPGDRVAILAENRAEYVECYYAVPRAGRLLVPLNQRLHPDEWAGTSRSRISWPASVRMLRTQPGSRRSSSSTVTPSSRRRARSRRPRLEPTMWRG